METRYTSAVGTKFHEDGSLRLFPGNTIICRCLMEPTYSELVRAQDAYGALSFAEKLAFLPPSSFHMTVMELLCDQVRDPEHWSRLMPLDAPIEKTDEILASLLEKVNWPSEIRMVPEGTVLGGTIQISLRPADDESSRLLQAFREDVSRRTGIRFPGHDRYRFHITLSYTLQHLTDEEKRTFDAVRQEVDAKLRRNVPVITLGKPEYVLFNDMGEFRRHLIRRRA